MPIYKKIRILQKDYIYKMSLPFVLIVPGLAPINNFNCDNNIYHVDL